MTDRLEPKSIRQVLMPLLIATACAMTTGCATIAEKAATGLVARDIDAIDHEFKVFHDDLALFRQCLKQRGGACDGNADTALPHSSQGVDGQPAVAVATGTSSTLADSVANLPGDHPAKSAHELLAHPVVRQSAALHNHLRGHDATAVPGFEVASGRSAQGDPESTATMSLSLGHVQHLHKGLLSSLATTAWESLHDHCTSLLRAHANASDIAQLKADCRRVAFIRGYLGAYADTGEFVKVDVALAGAIKTVDDDAAEIERDIDRLVADLQQIQTDANNIDSATRQSIDHNSSKLSTRIDALLDKVGDDLVSRFGQSAAQRIAVLRGLQMRIDGSVSALTRAAAAGLDRDVARLTADLQDILSTVTKELNKLRDEVVAADRKIVDDINNEVAKADASLSNVFKVTKVGFISRDHTFRARLPTLEVTIDPTIGQLIEVTDVDTGKSLDGASLRNLGVATDTSGVGTGGRIGAELIRVFLEAVFDAHEGLPAVAPANQPDLRPTGLTLGEYGLPLFTSPMGHVDSSDFSRMTRTNDRVATNTQVILSRVISGIGPFSLNNEPLESFIVEIVTTSVRKAVAKATWCWYACDLNTDVSALERDVDTTVADEKKQIEAKLKQDAEYVKLRLKLAK